MITMVYIAKVVKWQYRNLGMKSLSLIADI